MQNKRDVGVVGFFKKKRKKKNQAQHALLCPLSKRKERGTNPNPPGALRSQQKRTPVTREPRPAAVREEAGLLRTPRRSQRRHARWGADSPTDRLRPR